MEKFYDDFYRKLFEHRDSIAEYVDSLYEGETYSEEDLNQIFGELKREGLITCLYADNRAWEVSLTVSGKHYFDNEERCVNKPYLAELIEQIDDIEKAFHRVGGGPIPEYDEIHDVQKYQDWLQAIKLELQEIYDCSHDQFIWETIRTCEKPMNGTNDRKIFGELVGKLKAIKHRLDKYYPNANHSQAAGDKGTITVSHSKKPLIFISHSSKNKTQVEMLVTLLRTLNLQDENIFCSSVPGYGIPVSMNIFDFLRSRFLEYDMYIIFVHSKEYYESPVSLNEMGAAWALKSSATSILLPGFDYADMRGVVDSRDIAIKLDSDKAEVRDKLNQMRRTIESEFGFNPIQDIIWEQARDKFIDDVNDLQTKL